MSKTMNLQEQEGWKNQERAYEQGLLAGTTRAIALIRDLQRDYGRWDEGNAVAILNEAMELISEKIK